MPSTIEEIKSAITLLPEKEYVQLRNWFAEQDCELLSKVVFELKIKRQSGFQESPRFHQRIVHLQSPLPGNQSHVTFSNSFLHIVPA